MLDFVVRDAESRVRIVPRIGFTYSSIAPFFGIADAILVIVATVVGCSAYQFATYQNFGEMQSYAGQGLVAALAYGLSAHQLGLYQLQNLLRQRRDYWRIVASVLLFVGFLTVVLFLLKVGVHVSRGSVVSVTALATILLITWRAVAKRRLTHALRDGSVRGTRMILIGTSNELVGVKADALLFQYGIDEIGRVLIPRHAGDEGCSASDLAAVTRAIDQVRGMPVEGVILCVPWDRPAQLQFLRDRLQVLPLPVQLLPDHSVRSVWEHQALTSEWPPLVELQRTPLTVAEQFFKRAFDVVIAAFSLAMLAPLMVLTAIAVRLESRAPVLFCQRRKGFNGREFQIYKFRTMTVLEDGEQVVQAKRHDVRVTKLGRILRRTSIDELPQLFNVLRGEMSIVGPRPHAVSHDDDYGIRIRDYALRSHVKPGITGWAQVHGFRGGTPRLEQMQRRVELDLWYINNWNVALDLRILVNTCFELMRSRNAY